MISDIPVGMQFYMQRPGADAERLDGIVHKGAALFDVPAQRGSEGRTSVNIHRLLNFYDKYFAGRKVYASEKYPLETLFFANGLYEDLSVDQVLEDAQEPCLLSTMNVEAAIQKLPSPFRVYYKEEKDGITVQHYLSLTMTSAGRRFGKLGGRGEKVWEIRRRIDPDSKNGLQLLYVAEGADEDRTLFDLFTNRRPIILDPAAVMARHAAKEEAESEADAICRNLRRLPDGLVCYAQAKGGKRRNGLALWHDDRSVRITSPHGVWWKTAKLWFYTYCEKYAPSCNQSIDEVLFVAEGEWKDKSIREVLQLLYERLPACAVLASKHAKLRAELEELQALESRVLDLRRLKEVVATKRTDLFTAAELAGGEVGLFAATAAAQAEMQAIQKIEKEVMALRELNASIEKAKEILTAAECLE
jgi:hypothetical protein